MNPTRQRFTRYTHWGSMNIPESMKEELAAWNVGQGIDLEAWVGCSGNFSLAVGYISVFWPNFVKHDGYILREEFSKEVLYGFEAAEGGSRKSVEWVMNHIHVADIQHRGCKDPTKDKILVLGNTLKEIYEAKLKWEFPDSPCTVEFYIPEDEEDLDQYQNSFWQNKHETVST